MISWARLVGEWADGCEYEGVWVGGEKPGVFFLFFTHLFVTLLEAKRQKRRGEGPSEWVAD